jgi:titin
VITSLVEGDGTLEVHWSAPADGTPASYTVWVGGDVPDADCEEISAETHTCTINQGIVNETSYAVEVAANMAQGDPTISQPWWATPRDTDVGVPGAPVLDDIAVHGNKLTLTWAEPQDDGGLAILGYHITAMRTSDSEPVACVQPQGRTSRTCTITGTTETGYKATVAAWNSEGVGAASAEKTETALSSVPGTPTVTADLSENTATVHASSSDTGGVTVEGYEIAVTKVGSNDPVPCTGTKTSEEPILYTMGTCAFDSTQGESYSVKVRGKNSVGYSALATVTRTTAPAAPTVSVAVEGRTVTVSWTPHGTGGAAIQGYLVMVQRTGHEEHEEEVACTGTMGSGDNSSLYTGTKCTFTGIPGEEYSASVRARNSVGTSDIAGTDSDTVPPLAGPAGVTAMPGDAKATVTWKAITPATGITGYVVSYTKEGGQTQTAPVSGAATTSHELTGLENKATYSIAVKAVISEGTVAEGTAILVTPAAPPTIPDSPPEPDGDLTAPAGTTTPDPGEQITISGGGFAPNSRVDLVIYSEPHNLGTVITDQAGSFTRAVTVPHGLSGSHTIASFGVDSDGAARVLSLRVTITATTGGSGLAVTGAPIIAILLTGILLIAAGATTRFVGRYRRS